MISDAKIEFNRQQDELEEVRDHDQPTERAHQQHVERKSAPFTPEERRLIRLIISPNT